MTAKFKGFRSEVMEAPEAKGFRFLDLYIYDVISDWGVSAADVARAIDDAGDVERINVFINSPGGSVWEGMAIHSLLKRHPAHVTVVVDSLAASMASIIAMVGDEIKVMPGAMVMIHNPLGGVYGQSKDMKKYADLLDKIKAVAVSIYAKRTGRDAADIEQWMDEETWFTAEEALENGFADALDDVEEDDAKAIATFDLSGFKNVPESLKGKHLRNGLATSFDVVARYDQSMLPMVAQAGAEGSRDIESLLELPEIAAALMTKRNRVQPDGNSLGHKSQKEKNHMDPKTMQAMREAGLIDGDATKRAAELVLAAWYSVQNREQPESVDQIVADLEAGVQFAVPEGHVLTTQDAIDAQVAAAKAEATAEADKGRTEAITAAVAETKGRIAEILARCQVADLGLEKAADMVKRDLTVEEAKDEMFAELCKIRKPVGVDSKEGNSKPDPDQKYRAEFDALGGEAALGVTVEQYIATAKEMATCGLPE